MSQRCVIGQYCAAEKTGMALSPLTTVQNIRFRFTTQKKKVDMQALYTLTNEDQRKKFISNLRSIRIKTFYFSWGGGKSTRLNAMNDSITMQCCNNSIDCQCALKIHLQI
jgi:hypothetical protein